MFNGSFFHFCFVHCLGYSFLVMFFTGSFNRTRFAFRNNKRCHLDQDGATGKTHRSGCDFLINLINCSILILFFFFRVSPVLCIPC